MRPEDYDREEIEGFPLSDSIDNAILMHRDVHFGGNFDIMLNYYQKGGKGINQEFDIPKIQEMAQMEKQMQQNLAAVLLTGSEAEEVADAREAYKKLRSIYEAKTSKSSNLAKLMADLILSEEEEPKAEIEAVVNEKSAIVPLLVDLLKSENFYNPLYPGYGLAPALAANCLGRIGDKRAIISLFESIGTGDFFNEDIILESLQKIGEPAKNFLLKVLHGRPLNEDNERAAIALIQFRDDPEVSSQCFQMLQDPEVLKDLPLSTYLVLACEGLKKEEQDKFIKFSNDSSCPKALREDMKVIIQGWK